MKTAIVLCLSLFAISAYAAERVVLFEEFTQTG